jgi:hypothetical protein
MELSQAETHPTVSAAVPMKADMRPFITRENGASSEALKQPSVSTSDRLEDCSNLQVSFILIIAYATALLQYKLLIVYKFRQIRPTQWP